MAFFTCLFLILTQRNSDNWPFLQILPLPLTIHLCYRFHVCYRRTAWKSVLFLQFEWMLLFFQMIGFDCWPPIFKELQRETASHYWKLSTYDNWVVGKFTLLNANFVFLLIFFISLLTNKLFTHCSFNTVETV